MSLWPTPFLSSGTKVPRKTPLVAFICKEVPLSSLSLFLDRSQLPRVPPIWVALSTVRRAATAHDSERFAAEMQGSDYGTWANYLPRAQKAPQPQAEKTFVTTHRKKNLKIIDLVQRETRVKERQRRKKVQKEKREKKVVSCTLDSSACLPLNTQPEVQRRLHLNRRRPKWQQKAGPWPSLVHKHIYRLPCLEWRGIVTETRGSPWIM